MGGSPEGRRATPDGGGVTLELAILAPVLVLLVFTVVQLALWSFARSLALGAAQEGLAAARVESGTVQAGRTTAHDFLTRTGPDSLLAPAVVVRVTPSAVEVEVSGRAQSVLPGVSGLPVLQRARGPVERFTRP